jgi:hypothetical protein
MSELVSSPTKTELAKENTLTFIKEEYEIRSIHSLLLVADSALVALLILIASGSPGVLFFVA